MVIARWLINICSQDLAASRGFYTQFLGLTVAYDSDWYVQLVSDEHPQLELGVIQQDHGLIPPEFQAAPQGLLLTFVVDDVDALYERARAMAIAIVQPPKNEAYGQRRLLVRDPNGLLLDLSTPIAAESR
ncbi:MAG: VOC family protein [Leptolyngbyaceae cyanobacterium]